MGGSVMLGNRESYDNSVQVAGAKLRRIHHRLFDLQGRCSNEYIKRCRFPSTLPCDLLLNQDSSEYTGKYRDKIRNMVKLQTAATLPGLGLSGACDVEFSWTNINRSITFDDLDTFIQNTAGKAISGSYLRIESL